MLVKVVPVMKKERRNADGTCTS